MFERFNDRARRVLVIAEEEARLLNYSFVGTEAILGGLIREGDVIAAQALKRCGITLEVVRNRIIEIVGRTEGNVPSETLLLTPRAKKVLELALREAQQLSHDAIGPEHLLLGMIADDGGVATGVLQSLGVDLDVLRGDVFDLMSGAVENMRSGERREGTTKGIRRIATAVRPDPPPRCRRCGAGLAKAAGDIGRSTYQPKTPMRETLCCRCAWSTAVVVARAGDGLNQRPRSRILTERQIPISRRGRHCPARCEVPHAVAPEPAVDLSCSSRC